MVAVALVLITALPLLFVLYLYLATRKIRIIADKIPGPKTLPIIGNLHDCFDVKKIAKCHHEEVFSVDLFDIVNLLNKEFGSRSRVLLGTKLIVILGDPLDCEVVFSNHQFNEKSYEYSFLHPWLGHGLLTSAGAKWKSHRRAITPAFHFKILENFISVFNSRSDVYIDKLYKNCNTGLYFDIFPLNALLTLDVMCETAMGVTMNVQNNINSPYVLAVNEISNVIQTRFKDPFKRYDFFFKLSSDFKTEKKTLAVIQNTTNSVINDRRKRLQESQDTYSTYTEENLGVKKKMVFLDLLLLSTIDGSPLTNQEISDEVNTFLFEGYDTTTSGLSFCMYMLGENPECQKIAFEEQYSIFGDDKKRPATYNELQSMKYLDLVLKETLRLFPSVPLIARHISKDTFINDLEIPAGTTVAINVFGMHRNPDIFPEPEKFIPERHLPDQSNKRNPFAYVSFSAGARNCIGQKFVMLEMKSVLSKILRNFKIQSSGIELQLTSALILRTASGVNIKLNSRNYP